MAGSDRKEEPDWWRAPDGRWYSPDDGPDDDGSIDVPPADAGSAPEAPTEKVDPTPDGGRGCLAVMAGLFLLWIVLFAIFGRDDNSSPSGGGGGGGEPSGLTLRYGAFDVCTQFVRDQLRAPSTASFPNERQNDGEVSITGSAPIFTVRSHVDSQNGFGATVRSDFVCQVRHTGGDRFLLIDLDLDQR